MQNATGISQNTHALLAGRILDEYSDLQDSPSRQAHQQTPDCGRKTVQTPDCQHKSVQTPDCGGKKDQTPDCKGQTPDCQHQGGHHPKKAMSWIDLPRA